MNPEIFREYDIRGVVGKDFDESFARVLGRAFARVLMDDRGKKATLGQDCRLSSPSLGKAMIQGMVESGLEVADLGVGTTPMLYFSLHHLNPDGGLMISGSHNPPDQNGFKVCVGKETLFGPAIQRLREIIEKKDFPSGRGSVTSRPIRDDYIRWISEHIQLGRPLKVVVDAGNGTAGPVAPRILRNLGCEVIELYTEMDGHFPNHHPDPTVEKNLADLRQRVKAEKADCGISYDGDADRIGVINDQGGILWGDTLMIVLSRALLKEAPGATIIGEVKCSHLLYDDIAQRGGKPIMWKAGHSLIKAKMRETKAELGGEMSGHIFYQNRYFGFDDAIYTSCRLLELLSRSPQKLSEMTADLPQTFTTPEIRINSSDERKFQIVEEAVKFFSAKHQTITVDGVRVVFPDGWGLVRASNTQPMLVMRFEAESEKRLAEIRNLIESKIAELNR